MKVHFFDPPPAQKTGGLEAAIQALREALQHAGVTVDRRLPGDGEPGHVVHFHGLWQPAHARLSAECVRLRIPFVVSPHGMLEPWAWRHKRWKKWPYFHLVEWRHLARASSLLATAPAEARRLRVMFPRQRVECLPLGLTGDARPDYERARAALGWREDERVLLFLSRIHIKKGLDLLLHALTDSDAARGARLVIVGDGEESYVRKLRSYAETHAARLPPLDWIGAVWGDERWKYFQGADLFCLPSHSENFGLAVLEACQVGTPALTTSATPWADHLADGRGFIAEARVESLRDLLAKIFAAPRSTPDQRAKLAEWAWETFRWETLAPKYAAFYETLR